MESRGFGWRALPRRACHLSCALSIDCAGILKLRNSDIELRKGETDIGRKNTRVRLVFRVHVPQGGGKVVSVQAASVPIECCEQRGSGHFSVSYDCVFAVTYFLCPLCPGSPYKLSPYFHHGCGSGEDGVLVCLCYGLCLWAGPK